MKKVLAVALILVLLVGTLGLTACGDTKAENEIWIGVTNAGYGIEWLKETISEFEAIHPEYKVTIKEESPNYDSMGETQLNNYKTAKNDVYIISEVWWKTNAKNNYFVSLDDVYAAPFNENVTIEEAMREENRNEAKVIDKHGEEHYYVINYTSTASGLIYNKTIGDYYEGLPQWSRSVPKMATIKNGGTIDQLIAWMKEVERLSYTYYDFGDGTHYLDNTTTINTEGGTKPAVYPIVYAGTHSYWDAVVDTLWAQAEGIDGYRAFFEYDSPAVYKSQARLDALEALERLEINANMLPGTIELDHTGSQNEFLKGRAALIPCGDWMYYESKEFADACGTVFEMIYVPAPTPSVPTSQRKYVQYSDGGLCVIPNNDNAHVEIAKEFLKYLFSEEGCKNYTEETGSMWGFDGYADPDVTYATQLIEAGLLSTFNEGVIELVTNANARMTTQPKNLNAHNAAFGWTSGVAGAWVGQSGDYSLTGIREGKKTGAEVHEYLNNYVDGEWARWYSIVHDTAA